MYSTNNTNQVDDVLPIEKLSGANNFQEWKLLIEVAFQSAGLDEIVAGAVKLEDLSEYKNKEDFIRKDAQAKKTILATINKTVLNHILHCKTSKNKRNIFKIS